MPKQIYTHAFASVRFSAPDLDPLAITLALRLPPDHQHRRGEPRISRLKSGDVREYAPYRAGLWSMSSEPSVNSPSLDVHLQWLLEQLEPKSDIIQSLAIDGLEIDFFCFSQGKTGKPPSVPRHTRERAARLGIVIVVDHYDSSNDQPPAELCRQPERPAGG